MLGWWISIYKQADLENAEKAAQRKEHRLATWECAINGIHWLEALVETGLATKNGDGYPYRYHTLASHVLKVIAAGPPKHDGPLVIGDDYVLPGSWTGQINFNHQQIADCPSNEPLIIEVWDLS